MTGAGGWPAPAAFLSRASLQQPLWLVDSAWHQHAPFGAWLVDAIRPGTFVELGTHAGFSYFALCQAIAAAEAGTRCWAVDHWRGDGFTGAYDESVFDAVNGHNSALYAHFSTLLRRDFDHAAGEFADGSVDLLHVDGDHTYEAVARDFRTWLPKMSARGVVLLHDTAEFAAGYQVMRFWRELAADYPVFAFTHGHGLGVVLVGSDPPAVLAELAAHNATDTGAMVREWYARLGLAISTEWEARSLRADLAASRAAEARQVEAAVRAQAAAEAAATARSAELIDGLQAALAAAGDLQARLARDLDDVLAEHVRLAEREAVLRLRLASAESAVETLAEAAAARAEQDGQLSEQASAAAAEARAARADAQAARADLDAVLSSTSWRMSAPLRRIRGH